MMLKVYLKEILLSTLTLIFCFILSGLALASVNKDLIKIISVGPQLLIILFFHLMHYGLIVLLNIYRQKMKVITAITCISLSVSLMMTLWLREGINLPLRNEDNIMSMVWMLPIMYCIHMVGRLMIESSAMASIKIHKLSDAIFEKRYHFYGLISVLPVAFILFPINGYSLLSNESYVLVNPLDGLILNIIWILYGVYYLGMISLMLGKGWSGPRVRFKKDTSQLMIVEHVMTPIMSKMIRKLDSLDEYRSQLKNITGTYPEIQLITTNQYNRYRKRIDRDAINHIHLYLFHISDLSLMSDLMVNRYMLTFCNELLLKGRKIIVAIVSDGDKKFLNDRQRKFLDEVNGCYNRTLNGNVRNIQKMVKEEAYSLIVAEALKKKVISHLNGLDMDDISNSDDVIANEFHRLVNHIRTSASVIDDFYRIIRLFDYIIHIQAFHDICLDMDDPAFEEMTRELSFPASGKWIIKWKNEFQADKSHVWKQSLPKDAKTDVRDVCKMVNISFDAKKPKWVFALENGIVGLRNKTIGHGIVTYELCDSALLKLLNILYLYVMCHMEHGSIKVDDRIMKVMDGDVYILTGYSYGSKEYMDYSTGDLYREKKLILKTCEDER